MRMDRGLRCTSVCVASTCSTSLVPMPKASAPNAPCVAVWLSPQTIVMPGCVTPSSGPITCTMPWRSEPSEYSGTPNSAQLRSSVSTCTRLSSSRMRAATGVPSVGTLWSAGARVGWGRRTERRARGGRQKPGRLTGSGVLEVMGQAGVEGDAVAGAELVALAVDVEHDGAVLHDGDLAAAGLVHGGIPPGAGLRAGREDVAAELGAQARQRRGDDLDAVPGGPRAAASPLAGADDVHRAGLVEAQQLAEAQLEPGGDAAGDLQRRARLATLDLAEHRGTDARAQRQVAQREVHRLAQGAHARPDVDGGVFQDSHDTNVRYRIQACKRGAHGAERAARGAGRGCGRACGPGGRTGRARRAGRRLG